MARNASPMEFVPDAHAVTTFVHFPRAPNCMETFPAAMLEIISGTINGLTLEGPFSIIFVYSRSTTCRLPIPDPTITPTRNGSSFSMSIPASANASFAAATAY